jgi:hypothetical protein
MRRVIVCLLLTASAPAVAAAQLITIRTLPVSQSDQFTFFPNQNLGMGGVSLALNDTLLDPFLNPAKGARLRVSQVLGSPSSYTVTSGAGAGRTLPLGAFTRSGSWFGSAFGALQQIDAARQPEVDFFGPRRLDDGGIIDPQGLLTGLDERRHGNSFAFLSLGKADTARGLSFGGSALWSRLHAVDGVDLLYANSAGVRQLGTAIDLRLGALQEWKNGRTLEAVVLFDHYEMSHGVTYLDMFWDPGLQTFNQRARLDQNLDHTNTWGLHVAYTRPMAAPGWRIGWAATANHMTHPKIPNYEIMSVPRDPGNSNALNLGVGISRTHGPATFGVDVIYEPIWSHTWADSETPVETITGDTIAPGGMTLENQFRFSNALLRLGVATDFVAESRVPSAGLQFGLVVRSISYRLEQFDHVSQSGRTQEESWIEWTPTWGAVFRLPGWELRYQGQVTHGTGRPGVTSSNIAIEDRAAPLAGGGILAAPSGPLTLDEVRVVSHRISVAVPLR